MMWNLYSASRTKRFAAAAIVLAVTWLVAANAAAQTLVELPMEGRETIDAKERISGDAAVGINFTPAKSTSTDPDDEPKFDIESVYAYFYDKPEGTIRTQVTTVDGRYYAEFETPERDIKKGDWAKLKLSLSDKRPLSKEFLRENYDRESEIAVLVTDSSKPKAKSFPVRLGDWCATDNIRIRVNAEGADAYVVRFIEVDGKRKGTLAQCDFASDKPQFKFDHNCDMALVDIKDLDTLQVIRKRGSTYEKAIPIELGRFTKRLANGERACGI